MKNYIDIIKNFTKEDYIQNKVNLHIHSKYSDGTEDFNTITNQAKKKGYKYFSITDHNTIQGYLDNPTTSAIPGVEFDVWYKYIFLHLLAYGIDINNKEMQKFYAKDKRGTEMDIIRFLQKEI